VWKLSYAMKDGFLLVPCEKRRLATIQALDVYLPTTDGRHLVMPRYTEPDADVALLLHQLRLVLPQQPPPRLVSAPVAAMPQLKM